MKFGWASDELTQMSFANFTEPFPPVTGSALGMHHRYDPHALGFIQIDHHVRETACQCATGGWLNSKKRSGWRRISWMSRSISS